MTSIVSKIPVHMECIWCSTTGEKRSSLEKKGLGITGCSCPTLSLEEIKNLNEKETKALKYDKTRPTRESIRGNIYNDGGNKSPPLPAKEDLGDGGLSKSIRDHEAIERFLSEFEEENSYSEKSDLEQSDVEKSDAKTPTITEQEKFNYEEALCYAPPLVRANAFCIVDGIDIASGRRFDSFFESVNEYNDEGPPKKKAKR
jgi:hypothetical protein